jgi:uncharacterized membrane protein
MKDLRNYFITGLATLLPVSLTLFLFWFIVTRLGNILGPVLRNTVWLARLPDWVASLLGFALLMVATVGLGAAASGIMGRWLLAQLDRLLRRVPVVKDVYGSARQLTDAVFVQRSSLRKTVIVEYPRTGMFAIGFLTSDVAVRLPNGRNAYYVFIPTTPNPTSGWLALVPVEEATETTLSIEEGLKLVVSGGVINPGKDLKPG